MTEHSYFIRITPYETLSYEDIIQTLSDISCDKYFICYEEATRPHYHLCIWCVRSVENLRYRLKDAINGQIYISGKQIEDKLKAIAYCMKDGNYRHNNVNILDIMSAKSISKKKDCFNDEVKKIDQSLSGRQLLNAIIDIYIKYDRKIYKQHIKSMYDLIMIKKDKSYRDKIIDEILGINSW